MSEILAMIGLLLVGAAAYTVFVVNLTLWVLAKRQAREDAMTESLERMVEDRPAGDWR